MKKNSRVSKLLGIEYPVIQAAMSWVTSAELAAAVSNTGGLGLLGPNAGQTERTPDPVETAERMRQEIRKTRQLTKKPFAAQLLVMGKPDAFSEPLMAVYCVEDVDAILCLNSVPQEYVDRLRAAGKKLLYKHIAPTSQDFIKAEKMGYDAIIVAGVDCGGHTHTMNIGTLTAIRIATEATSLPVIAAGGIIDAVTVKIAGMLGAEGVYAGTRFVACKESPVAQRTKEKMLELTTDDLIQISGIYGPIHVTRSPVTEKCYDLMMEGLRENAMNVTMTYSGGYREGMLLGNYESSMIDVSAAIGQIKEILSAQEIMDEFAKGMED